MRHQLNAVIKFDTDKGTTAIRIPESPNTRILVDRRTGTCQLQELTLSAARDRKIWAAAGTADRSLNGALAAFMPRFTELREKAQEKDEDLD